MANYSVRKLVFAAVCVALGLFLPFLTGQIPQIGSQLCPMHIPVLLCGFLCGWKYGLLAGIITPLLRSALFSMPPFMPTAVAMAFELAAYGAFTGLFYKLFPKNTLCLYATLVLSMLLGRLVWGVASVFVHMVNGSAFTFAIFLANGFANAAWGIVLHIIIIPPIVMALKKQLLPVER